MLKMSKPKSKIIIIAGALLLVAGISAQVGLFDDGDNYVAFFSTIRVFALVYITGITFIIRGFCGRTDRESSDTDNQYTEPTTPDREQ